MNDGKLQIPDYPLTKAQSTSWFVSSWWALHWLEVGFSWISN